MRQPYLVQRGKINTPLAPESCCFSEAVQLDYMGSAEFEFGAVARSTRALQAGVDNIKKTVVTSIMENGVPLKVLHMFSEEDFKEYEKYLLRMRGNDIRLKEVSGFCPDDGRWATRNNFWWDIENHVMWSFNKVFMNRLPDYLINSWKYMDEQKALREQQPG